MANVNAIAVVAIPDPFGEPTPREDAIRAAIGLAFEGLAGPPQEWVSTSPQLIAAAAHLVRWVSDYSARLGLGWSTAEITERVNMVLTRLRSRGES